MTAANEHMAGRSGQSAFRREIAVIPGWAFVIAALIFIGVIVLFFKFVWSGGEPYPPALPLQILFTLLPASILALLALMIGYVNRDAGRRGMSRALWTALVIFIPNAIGFILYFLFRKPIRSECPKCSADVDPRMNYCPRCGYSFHPTCPQCKAALRNGDAFCANCGIQVQVA